MAQHFYLAEPAAAHHVYVGATDPEGHSAVYRLRFEIAGSGLAWAGSKEPAGVREEKGGPWVALAPDGGHLYLSIRQGGEEANNYIASYAIDRESGALTEAGSQPTMLPGSPHCVVDPSNSMLISSQMAGGGATSFPLSGGVLQPPKTVMPFGEHCHWR